jgi:hypothetical protein
LLRSRRAPSTWNLVADLLTGRQKGKVGRPKMTREERRAINPIHDAAELVPVISKILRRLYPKQTTTDIRDRALKFAADFYGIKDSETLRNHRARSRKDRRRIK